MKRILVLVSLVVFGLARVHAQVGRGGGPPPGPGLSGSTAKLFGDNSAFSAALEMQSGGSGDSESMSIPGKLFFDQGKSRFEMDMSQLKGGPIHPGLAASMKAMGMDKVIMIARPDKKLGYQIYPGLQAYIENALPEQEASTSPGDFKIEMTEVGKETVDGHPCIKNNAVVTDKEGTKHESIVWNATDLKQFPVRIEYTENGTKIIMLFRDVNLSKPAANLFDPPADSTKYESTESLTQQVMMKRMRGAGGPGAARPPGTP